MHQGVFTSLSNNSDSSRLSILPTGNPVIPVQRQFCVEESVIGSGTGRALFLARDVLSPILSADGAKDDVHLLKRATFRFRYDAVRPCE